MGCSLKIWIMQRFSLDVNDQVKILHKSVEDKVPYTLGILGISFCCI